MANNFSGDPNIVSVYRFEPGAMLVDSIVANGNDLTVYGSPPMQVDEVNFVEGAGSIYLNSASSDAVYRTDANLSTGHPLKSTAVSPKFSIAAWIRPATFPAAGSSGYIITKTRADIDHRTFSLNWFGNRLMVRLGHGSSYEILVEDTTTTYTVGNWYHVAVTYDDTTKAWTVRVYDQTNNTTQNFNGTATSNIYMGTALFILGGQDNAGTPAQFSHGRLDEVVITKDVLTGTEIDQIRTGTYSAGGPIPPAKPNRMLLLGVGSMSLLEKLRARKNKLSGGRS